MEPSKEENRLRAELTQLNTQVNTAQVALAGAVAQTAELVLTLRWNLQLLLQQRDGARSQLMRLEAERAMAKVAEEKAAEAAKTEAQS
jgi:uncharacterized membrane-anchored protein YhcB (DUF1043 family)